MTWAAVVLTGGRSRRLGGMPKADIVVAGRTLLASTYAACQDIGAQVVVVVGPAPDGPPGAGDEAVGRDGGPGLVWTREDPPFGGPARAVAAGVAALAQRSPAPGAAVAVLACDMPEVGAALSVLARAVVADGGPAPGSVQPVGPWRSVLGTSPGPAGAQVQWLLGIHRWEVLRDACSVLSPDSRVSEVGSDSRVSEVGSDSRVSEVGPDSRVSEVGPDGPDPSVRELLAPLRARRIPVSPDAAADIDTWTDLHARLSREANESVAERTRLEGRTYRAGSL